MELQGGGLRLGRVEWKWPVWPSWGDVPWQLEVLPCRVGQGPNGTVIHWELTEITRLIFRGSERSREETVKEAGVNRERAGPGSPQAGAR